MKSSTIALATVLLIGLALIVVVACGGGGGSDEDAVRDVLAKEIAAINDNDRRAMYNLYSPQAQSFCSYDEYAASHDWSGHENYAVSDVKVSFVSGGSGTARVTATVTYDGGQDALDGTFLKNDGQWYDDGILCPTSTNLGTPQATTTPKPTSTPKVSVPATATPTRGATHLGSATPTPTPRVVHNGTFSVTVDAATTSVVAADCTIKYFGEVDIKKAEQSFSIVVNPSTDGQDITKGTVQFTVGGIRYTGNATGTIDANLESGSFSGTFIEPDAGITNQVTGSYSC